MGQAHEAGLLLLLFGRLFIMAGGDHTSIFFFCVVCVFRVRQVAPQGSSEIGFGFVVGYGEKHFNF